MLHNNTTGPHSNTSSTDANYNNCIKLLHQHNINRLHINILRSQYMNKQIELYKLAISKPPITKKQ